MTDLRPLIAFVTGTGRSGTNITKALLQSHPDCAALPFEYRFTIDPGGLVDFLHQMTSSWSPFLVEKRIKALEHFLQSLAIADPAAVQQSRWIKKNYENGLKLTPQPYAAWELDLWMPGYSSYVKELVDELTSFRYHGVWPGAEGLIRDHEMYYSSPIERAQLIPPLSDFWHKCISAFLQKASGKIFIEDNTWSSLMAADILDLAPTGKMIFVERDYRDVIASLLHQRWTPSDLQQAAIWYRDVLATWHRQRDLLSPDSFIEIRFETLISDTKYYIETICSFLDIEPHDAMYSIDISKGHIGRYTEQFTTAELSIIEDIVLGHG